MSQWRFGRRPTGTAPVGVSVPGRDDKRAGLTYRNGNMKRTIVGVGKIMGRATGGRVKKQTKSARKATERAKQVARKVALKAEDKAHRAAVKAEAKAHRAAVKAEALNHNKADKAERRAHQQARSVHLVVMPDAVADHEAEAEPSAVETDLASPISDAQAAYEAANRSLDEARRAFADLDWSTHTREDWIAASARLRQAWAVVDAARIGLQG